MPHKDPENARRYQREYRKARKAEAAGCGDGLPVDLPTPTRIAAAGDVLGLLEEQAAAIRANLRLLPTERARVMATLCSVALKAIELNGLAARLEAVERMLKLRGESG